MFGDWGVFCLARVWTKWFRWAGVAGVAALVLAPCIGAAADGYVRRLQSLALLQTLNADLLSHDSATAVLQGWCDAHAPGGLKIAAERVKGQDKAPSEAASKALGLKPGQAVRYR